MGHDGDGEREPDAGVKAYDAAGNVGTSTAVTVTVNNVSTLAVYDSALMAPKCGTVNGVCDSGPSLLNGRANLGPELNKPNTVGGHVRGWDGGRVPLGRVEWIG